MFNIMFSRIDAGVYCAHKLCTMGSMDLATAYLGLFRSVGTGHYWIEEGTRAAKLEVELISMLDNKLSSIRSNVDEMDWSREDIIRRAG